MCRCGIVWPAPISGRGAGRYFSPEAGFFGGRFQNFDEAVRDVVPARCGFRARKNAITSCQRSSLASPSARFNRRAGLGASGRFRNPDVLMFFPSVQGRRGKPRFPGRNRNKTK